jgi:twinkle protein
MRATELAKLLAAQVETVARDLLPNGKKVGHEWRVGSIAGEAGKSMGVHLTGDKAGVWLDGESGLHGDMIGLWMAVKGMDLRDACRDASAFLGIKEDRVENPRRVYAKPTREGVTTLSPEHTHWLRDVRKLPAESIAAYKLASRGDRLMFPYLAGDELVFAKYRRLPKQFSTDADCEPILFGWQAISPRARAVCITEGELDAIAMHAYGFPALSVPTGAGAHGWIEREFDRLDAYDTIYLAMDMDAAGQKHIATLCERLGRERTHVVQLPSKDANACLMDGVPPEEIIAAMRDARTLDPSELKSAADFEDAVVAEFERVDTGMSLPWRKGEQLLLREAEVSIWAGINGHGKSELMGYLTAWQATRAGKRCCIASLEMPARRWLKRIARQIAGIPNPSPPFVRNIMQRLRESMWVFDVRGTAKAQRLLEVFRYARKRYGIDLFVVDNLAKCGFEDDDYNGQKSFVDALTDFANETNTHVALLVHMRKGEDESKPAGKMSVKGSGALTDMADTVMEIWRNKPREEAKRRAEADARDLGTAVVELPEKFQKQSDVLLICHKQRNGECEPRIGLYFDSSAKQYLSREHYKPRAMVEFSLLDAEAARLSAA